MVDLFGVRTHWRRAEPQVPRERLRRRDTLRRTRTDQPVTLSTCTVGSEVHLLHGTYCPCAEETDTKAVTAACGVLRTELRDYVAALRLQSHLTALGNVVAERLLAIHVLAAPHGGERDDCVLVVRNGDIDGIDVLLLQHLAPVRVCTGLGRELRGLGEVV